MADKQKSTAPPPEQAAPAERPQYLVTVPPGAYIHGLGFVKPGSSFTAPEGYQPSRTFRAMNQAAALELLKLRAELEKQYEKREARKRTGKPAETDTPKLHEEVDATLYVPPAPAPPAVKEGVVDPASIARLDAGEDGGKRTADR